MQTHRFKYRVVSEVGAPISGVIEAFSSRSVVAILHIMCPHAAGFSVINLGVAHG